VAAFARRSLAGALGAQRPALDVTLRRSYNVRMSELRFAWDVWKETQNRRKHGVSFTEAETVFSDEHALLVDDREHSAQEDRFALLGLSARLRTLVVVHSYREEEAVIRIISARKATRRERDVYNRRWRA
jgi:uncharacterized protein